MSTALAQQPATYSHQTPFPLRTHVSDGTRDHTLSCAASPNSEIQAINDITKKIKSQPRLSLPAELHLEIIDIIARRVPWTSNCEKPSDPTDFETLCSCALVCKLWLSTARMGIWRGVRLSSREKSIAFVQLLRDYAPKSGDASPPWTIPSFGRHVSNLSVRETRGNAWDPKWLDEALPQLGAHLTEVKGLEMERVTWEYLSSRSRVACLEAFKHAKSLALREFVFHSTRDMYDFLGEFTELEVLKLDGVHFERRNTPRWLFDPEVDEDGAIKLPPNGLLEVGFRGVTMEPVLEWIMAGSDYQRKLGGCGTKIQSVRMGGIGVSEASIIGKFLREAGDSVRKVYVGFDTDFVERGDTLVREMELTENTNLEEFHVFGLVVPSPPPVDPFEQEPASPQRALAALTSLLSQIRSRMRVLSLALYPADVRAMSTVDFDGLAKVFAKKCVWSYVEQVCVVISNKEECGLGKVVRDRLRALSERGVLRVNVGFDEREVLY